MRFSVAAIGTIHSANYQGEGTPIQPRYAAGSKGWVELEADYIEALDDLAGYERIWLIYWFDRAQAFRPHVVPYRDQVKRGLFSTRAPVRPNPIGMSVVRLLGVKDGILKLDEVDILNGTPLLDIKPYVPAFDAYPDAAAGWHQMSSDATHKADTRFFSKR